MQTTMVLKQLNLLQSYPTKYLPPNIGKLFFEKEFVELKCKFI